ncbi:copper oxidase [Cryobacterium sp. MDB1-18-2]|uniref:multicopper oxidase domain-containing protein n=1 Tax=unclassified Cryobacterium TaxID=2649013 RepID=UPI00106DB202|nr:MULTISPECIES: multicopper oxidase domain-containing protein [unclassified Cryobacterium]TFC32379.1 copper oxidase [Cryobacterium sp. MDB1-18-2]TFC46104.1 copper oxidase [Cryobacterium sp. MDB1-18-1]
MKDKLWHIVSGSLVPAWLAAAVILTLLHRQLPSSGWLLVHLLLLGAVSTAILIWSQHFADTLLRRKALGHRLSLGLRLSTHTVGAIAVMTGIVIGWYPLVLVGGILVGLNALAHAAVIVGQTRGAMPGRFAPLVRYYVASAVMLAAGVTLGILMARLDGGGEDYERLFIGHLAFNLLGWVGLTVIGTIALLWPTVLHTRVAGATVAAGSTLTVLAGGLVLVGLGCLADLRLVVALGVLVYLVALGRVLWEGVGHLRRAPAVTFAAWSLGAAQIWFALCTLGFGLRVASAPSWTVAAAGVETLVPYFAIGFAAQILLGALSHLVPVVLGGGPAALKAAAAELDRGGLFRVVVVNGALLLSLLPVSSTLTVALSMLIVATLASFLVLFTRALRANRRVRALPLVRVAPGERPVQGPRPRSTGRMLAAASVLLLTVTVGIVVDPASVEMSAVSTQAAGSSGTAAATGHTTTVAVDMVHTRFVPDRIEVPLGDALMITLTNSDDMAHNLVLESGLVSGSLDPGTTTTVAVGVIGASVDGWCSIAGHRLLGMEISIVAVGDAGASATGDSTSMGGMAGVSADGSHTGHDAAATGTSAAADIDPSAVPDANFEAHDAVLPPAPDATVHRRTLVVRNVETEVAPGVTQMLWTFNGTAPGPTLRGRVGDVFEITLVNKGTVGHSIDFHAGTVAPDAVMRTIQPGESLVYTFTATRSGIWLYHCSTMPMSVHIANGMFGAVIIDPPGLADVDREYLLVQSELYLGAQGGEVDAVKVKAQTPDLMVFNGYANQYAARPLPARVGETVRVWVLDAGPNVGSAFHIVGGQFHTVYREGDYPLKDGGSTGTGGSQVLDLAAAQGGFVELSFSEAGHYPFVSHVMSDAEKGARGIFEVLP